MRIAAGLSEPAFPLQNRSWFIVLSWVNKSPMSGIHMAIENRQPSHRDCIASTFVLLLFITSEGVTIGMGINSDNYSTDERGRG